MTDATLESADLIASTPDGTPAGAQASRRVPAAAWAGLGFIVGAVFWHFVGFWSFVSDVVFRGQSEAPHVAVVRKNDIKAAGVRRLETKGEAAILARSCIKLMLDRTGGETRAADCTQGEPKLPHTGLARRDDMQASAADGWREDAEGGNKVARSE